MVFKIVGYNFAGPHCRRCVVFSGSSNKSVGLLLNCLIGVVRNFICPFSDYKVLKDCRLTSSPSMCARFDEFLNE